MFRLMAFDQSITQCGVAIFDGGDPRRIECLSFSCSGEATSLLKRKLFGMTLRKLFSRYHPNFVVFEASAKRIVAYGRKPRTDLGGVAFDDSPAVNSGQLLLPAIESQILQACIDYSIPFDCVAPATWRVIFKGMAKKGHVKEMARSYCKLNGIDANNHNEAEAAGIAVWGYAYSQPFKLLRYAPTSGQEAV
jgi:hypothetical protein